MTGTLVELGDVCEFKYGKSLAAAVRDGGQYPVYGSNGIVGSHSATITDGPTIIIGRKGSFGEIAFSEGSCWPIDTTYFVDASATNVDLKWLSYRLRGLGLTELNRAAAVPGLNREDAYRQKLLLPPIGEQRRIAELLDHTDAIRAKRRQTLACLDELSRATFLNMFGAPATWPDRWHMGTIGDLADDVQYGTASKAGGHGAWPIIRMGNLTDDGRLDLSDLKWIDLSETEIPRFTVQRGDLLFNRTNSREKVGKTCVVDTDQPLAFAGYLVRVRMKPEHRAEYVNAFMSSRYGQAKRYSMAKAAINQANINATEMQSIPIALPPANLQQQFARAVADMSAQRERHLRAICELDALFASLQSRAFSGQL